MTKDLGLSEEYKRLEANSKLRTPLPFWGPYLSERQWGTVREDYSAGGDAWNYLNFEQSHHIAYKWGEDGIAGLSDRHQYLNFAVTVWNGKDALLKEKLFGLSNPQGNHGEDVKELYYYLENTPTHSFMKYLYKYPQVPFPYKELIDTNAGRTKSEDEYEILDTGVFDDENYFDILVEYAKQADEDLCIRITITNRGSDGTSLHILPTLWFRNIWSNEPSIKKPQIKIIGKDRVGTSHEHLPNYNFYFQPATNTFLTDNETNASKIPGSTITSKTPAKDAFHEALCENNEEIFNAISKKTLGTKFSPHYLLTFTSKETKQLKFRLTRRKYTEPFDHSFDETMELRSKEATQYFNALVDNEPGDDLRNVYKQALSGLLWNKQFYYYDIEKWLKGDKTMVNSVIQPRENGRNSRWCHLKISDVISMPDKWEYPWFAAWDLCFQCVPLAVVDPGFAKNQLVLLCREWFMSPEGQIPSYEWNFNDVNPPIQAWASLLVYNIEKKVYGKSDINFLKKMFHKLTINFTWWANREDDSSRNIFSGGFLGLDNIGVIDRSSLPAGNRLEQVDATAWMGMYALNMMEMALEISQIDGSYEDMVTKFYEHFVLIASSLNTELWDKDDKFFYDLLHTENGEKISLKVRSIVGLSVLFDASLIKNEVFQKLNDFQKRMAYLKDYRLKENLFVPAEQRSSNGDILISLIPKKRMEKLITIMLDENEFLSPGGLRALSKYHEENPFTLHLDNMEHSISYVAGESSNSMFGGNSNWRGPVWVPINYLLIETLYSLHKFYGDSFQLDYPTGSGNKLNLKQIADAVSMRIINVFKTNENGERLANGEHNWFYKKPENKDLLTFFEYFNGDTAKGLGASHQTGWTSLVAVLIHQVFDQ